MFMLFVSCNYFLYQNVYLQVYIEKLGIFCLNMEVGAENK